MDTINRFSMATQFLLRDKLIPVNVELHYSTADPYMVEVNFLHPVEDVVWHIGRELFVSGLKEKVGTHDIKIWPMENPYLGLRLQNLTENAKFLMYKPDIKRFLRATHAIVPYGKESSHIDFDRLLPA